MRIVFLADARSRPFLKSALQGVSGDVRDKVERALSVLEASTWQEALEGKLVSQLGKPKDTWVYEIQIPGKPAYRIAALPTHHRGESCLLVGDMVTRETLNNKGEKKAFIQRALDASERWRNQ